MLFFETKGRPPQIMFLSGLTNHSGQNIML